MSELFRPISTGQLSSWLFNELASRDSIFGIPRRHFFVPREDDVFRTEAFGHDLDTPFGPAAGPHSQMAQNIIAAWLCGARYMELKTVQTLDVLNVSKPCIDMQDEGYNVEWSQELRVFQSFDEYLRAWVLIHALHHKLGFPGDSPALVFNMSVGYDLEGIRNPNMQWFLDQMQDCSDYKNAVIEQLAPFYPAVVDLDIPDCLSDNVTLSTMHGCPPGEIESISAYLLQERHLHTLVKCNPTLLGPDRVRSLLHDDLHYSDVIVPDIAFEHDLKYSDAVPMLRNLQSIAAANDLTFGVKLSNTLEVENVRPVFDPVEKMSYLSGRPLHAVTVNLAKQLAKDFAGDLPLSFSAGASCFNAPQLLAAGMQTVTVCSDLLKTGGYLRLLDYIASVDTAFRRVAAKSITDFVLRTANRTGDPRTAALLNLGDYAERTRSDPDNTKDGFDSSHTKTARSLGAFDCIEAPCTDECPLQQDVPKYMKAVRDGNLAEAQRVVRADNPIPCTLGRVCDHLCEHACVRSHLDEPVAIRDIKRFIMDSGPKLEPQQSVLKKGEKIAIIGAGPGGMSAAAELAKGGMQVEVFEQHPYGGGMVGGAVPEYRLPQAVFDRDFTVLEALGVKVHYNVRVGRDLMLSQLRRDNFENVVIMVGAQLGKTLALPGEDCNGVVDALNFLRQSRENHALDIGERVGIVGAGDTAMDCARVAWRQKKGEGQVTLIYRRTIDQMPADREEVVQLLEEGIEVVEMSQPRELVVTDGNLSAVRCRRMIYAGERDASGRKIPREVRGSDFEIPLDTLILAISQHAVLDFFDNEPIRLNDRGYIDVDPVTFETSVPGIYAGGDVANDGPASIVKAAAAGKTIARGILRREPSQAEAAVPQPVDTVALMRRRSQRQRRVAAPHIDSSDRRNFNEVVLTYSAEQARVEASRCLDCDTFCSLCVSVCPNLALLTYRSEPVSLRLPELRLDGDRIRTAPGSRFQVEQPFQVAVLTDFCNECGNCTTFCPTSGAPYRDKPRLYLDRSDFEEQNDNAFVISRDGDRWMMDARWYGATHHIELNGKLDYRGPAFRARLDPDTFEIEQAESTGAEEPLSLQACASMYVLLKGVQQSIPFLPTALPDGAAAAGKIAHPGYEE